MEQEHFVKVLRNLVKYKQKKVSNFNEKVCEFCEKILTRSTHILCVLCNIPICIQCYSRGMTNMTHQLAHQYRVIDSLSFPILRYNWQARQELELLAGILKFGYGNWESIELSMARSKSRDEIEYHFKMNYNNKESIPDTLSYMENGYIVTKQNNEISYENIPVYIPPQIPYDKLQKHPLSDIIGYMAYRVDFDFEFQNDMEQYMADLDFYDDDRPQDTQVKFQQLELYNRVLNERDARKKFFAERWANVMQIEKNLRGQPIERSIFQQIKQYARFLSEEKFFQLFSTLIEDHKIRVKLSKLKEARDQGRKTEFDFKHFLKDNKLNHDIKDIYDDYLKLKFDYKNGEQFRDQLIANPDICNIDQQSEWRFFEQLGLNTEDYNSLKDTIAEQEESIITSQTVSGFPKSELFDYSIKPNTN